MGELDVSADINLWAEEESGEDTEQASIPEDELSDEQIIETAKGRDGARTVSGRISKYKREAEAEKQRAAQLEQQLEEVKSKGLQYEVTAKQMLKEFDVDADDPVSGLQTLLAAHRAVTLDEIQKDLNDQAEKEAALAQYNAIKAEQQQRAYQQTYAEHLAAIKQAYPDLDIVKNATHVHDFGQKFAKSILALGQLDPTSVDPVEAFELAFKDEVKNHQRKAVKQAAFLNTTSKDHLRSTDGDAGSRIIVPAETVRRYRDFFPDITLDEIRKDYAKRNKE
jgi:hypothetical protein